MRQTSAVLLAARSAIYLVNFWEPARRRQSRRFEQRFCVSPHQPVGKPGSQAGYPISQQLDSRNKKPAFVKDGQWGSILGYFGDCFRQRPFDEASGAACCRVSERQYLKLESGLTSGCSRPPEHGNKRAVAAR